MPSAAADERRAAYFALASTLGKLHTVKPAEVGLGNYSRNHGYCARQVYSQEHVCICPYKARTVMPEGLRCRRQDDSAARAVSMPVLAS